MKSAIPVSYTHLDVYKRQELASPITEHHHINILPQPPLTIPDSHLDENNGTTPSRDPHDFPGLTPKSLPPGVEFAAEEENEKSNNKTNQIVEEKTTSQDKPSPWSPFKVEQTLKSVMLTTNTSPISNKAVSAAKSSMVSKTTNSEVDGNRERIRNARIQRRSNMFVPLPNKDPLVVQQESAVKITDENNTTSSFNHLRHRTVKTMAIKKPIASSNNISLNSTAGSTGGSRTGTSIFERLSSLPTKSFENKITSKVPSRKFSSSSIDITGSPLKLSLIHI